MHFRLESKGNISSQSGNSDYSGVGFGTNLRYNFTNRIAAFANIGYSTGTGRYEVPEVDRLRPSDPTEIENKLNALTYGVGVAFRFGVPVNTPDALRDSVPDINTSRHHFGMNVYGVAAPFGDFVSTDANNQNAGYATKVHSVFQMDLAYYITNKFAVAFNLDQYAADVDNVKYAEQHAVSNAQTMYTPMTNGYNMDFLFVGGYYTHRIKRLSLDGKLLMGIYTLGVRKVRFDSKYIGEDAMNLGQTLFRLTSQPGIEKRLLELSFAVKAGVNVKYSLGSKVDARVSLDYYYGSPVDSKKVTTTYLGVNDGIEAKGVTPEIQAKIDNNDYFPDKLQFNAVSLTVGLIYKFGRKNAVRFREMSKETWGEVPPAKQRKTRKAKKKKAE